MLKVNLAAATNVTAKTKHVQLIVQPTAAQPMFATLHAILVAAKTTIAANAHSLNGVCGSKVALSLDNAPMLF